MLKRHATFVIIFRSISDICIIAGAWLLVYGIRFQTTLFATEKGIPDFSKHLMLTLPVVFICFFCCLFMGIYKPKRVANIFVQFVEILKVTVFSGLFIFAFFYFLQDIPYSRKLVTLFIVMLFVGLSFSHLLTMQMVRVFRRKGYNFRYYAIIGANSKGQQLEQDISKMSWLGLKCSFFIDNDRSLIGKKIADIPVYGPVEKIIDLVDKEGVDEVYLALDGNESQKAYSILEAVQAKGVTVRIIPDWGNLASVNNSTVITIGSQVLYSASESPLNTTNIVLKEIFDRVGAVILLVLFAPSLSIIALLVKLTSKGPVFYKQVRIGMDQKEFHMFKFRTMVENAEKVNTPKWTQPNDSRCTSIGRWLRRTSLDELPQLINVIKGDMSLIGPRPERLFFTEKFSEEYKKYMLRHKVKAGMTGWAQINGFRGDTSLRKRLLYDLYYVRNWSWTLDMWILFRTPWHIIKGENAH